MKTTYTMSSSNTKLGEDFLHVPKLAADRENWTTYKDRLSWSVDACGFLGHLEGTEKKPIDPSTLSGRGASWVLATPEEVREIMAYNVTLKEWCMGQAITKQQIASTIPDSLCIQVKGLDTVGEIFKHLSNLFEKRSWIVSVELLRKLQELKCPENGNIRDHFNKMCTIWEQLSLLGHPPSEESFAAMIMSSLPVIYRWPNQIYSPVPTTNEGWNVQRVPEVWSLGEHSVQCQDQMTLIGSRREYTEEVFTCHLHSKGTEHKLTVHDTPEHNRVAERLNHTIIERMHALLHASGLPKFLWGEAIMHVTWLKNRMPTHALDN